MVLSQRFLLDYNLLLLPSGMVILPCGSDLALFWTENFWPKKSCNSSLLIRIGFLAHQLCGQWEDYWRTTCLRSNTRVPNASAKQKEQMHGKNYGQGRSPVCLEFLLPTIQNLYFSPRK